MSRVSYDDLWTMFGMATIWDYRFKVFQKQWFLNRFNLSNEEFHNLVRGKKVLEVGTGAGAFLFNLLTAGAEEVYGIDLSESGIKLAKGAYEGIENVHPVKADLMEFEGEFDVVIADQVLHHLPNTFKALKKAVSLVRDGGQILFYVYQRKGPVREFNDWFIRLFTTRSKTFCLLFSKYTCFLGRVLTRVDIRLQRWVYWNILKCFWNDDFIYENNLRINYDWYDPSIANKHKIDEVLEWVEKLNLKPSSINVQRSGISVRASKC